MSLLTTAIITASIVGMGLFTLAALRKAIKRRVSWRATQALLTKVVKSAGAYHISFAALDTEGDVIERDTITSSKKINDDEIYEGKYIDL